MGKYRVKISNTNLDTSVRGGRSYQRAVYLPGPDGSTHELFDGEIVYDDYWLKYVYPNCSKEASFFTIIEPPDDKTSKLKIINKHVQPQTGYSDVDNIIDFMSNYQSSPVFIQISNQSRNVVSIRFNDDDEAILELEPDEVQILNHNDAIINKIELRNDNESEAKLKILFGIK